MTLQEVERCACRKRLGPGFRQTSAAGLNATEVDKLLTLYGLTPELVTTTISIAGQALAEWRIQRFLADLDDIPEAEAVRIEALIDRGLIAEAEAALNAIRNEEVLIVPRYVAPINSIQGTNTRRGAAGVARVDPLAGSFPGSRCRRSVRMALRLCCR